MTQTDIFIIKYKQAKMADRMIARKLCMTEAELIERWAAIVKELQERAVSGHNELCDYFTNLCAQYQLLGESLKGIGFALGNVMDADELRKLIEPGDREKTIDNLRLHAIILRPFVPIQLTEPKTDIEKKP